MDHLLAIRVFARVVEAGTFTRAADSLDMPKPTVTKLVQSLETHLRVKLFNRTTRRVTVTRDGAAYYERTARLLSELDDIEAGMTQAQTKPHGRLRVDIGTTPANLILIPALPEFYARYPDVQIDLGVSDRNVDLVGENVDCVIRGGEISDQSLVARRIAELGFVTCATPDYLERHGTPRHPLDLESGHLTLRSFSARTGRMNPMRFLRGDEEIEIDGPHRLAVNEATALITAVVSGLGVAQLPRFEVRAHLEAGRLVTVLQDWAREPLPTYLVFAPNRHFSAKLRVFVDWVAELFAREVGAPGPARIVHTGKQ